MRLDAYLHEKGYFASRTKAKRAIDDGKVYLDGKVCTRSSLEIDEDVRREIEVFADNEYVSLGGYKLEKALRDFDFSVKDMVVADLGASTGGFTDCLLQSGAKTVYAVDLNDELLDERLKGDKRVTLIVKNVKLLDRECFPEKIDLVTADLSFISLTKTLKIMSDIIDPGGYVIALIKPQFESETRVKRKNGIVKEESARTEACRRVYDFALKVGFAPLKITTAPLKQNKNVEYPILLKRTKNPDEAVAFDRLFD